VKVPGFFMNLTSPALILPLFAFGVATAYFANKMNKNPWLWFAIGMLFGWPAMLFLLLSPSFGKQTALKTMHPSAKQPVLSEIDRFFIHPKYMQQLWFYLDIKRNQVGPVSLNGLKQAYSEGKVTHNSWVWNDSFPEWKKIHSLLAEMKKTTS